ncbi:MAG: hypothetical protein HQL53_09475 [Magnetococcales bacterium]|nr:hypothetical protein [Magnetococcales bacterium]
MVRFLVFVLAVGCLAGVVLGVWVLLYPRSLQNLTRTLSELLHPLRRPIRPERFIYRRHRLFGLVVTLGSLYTFSHLHGYVGENLTLKPGWGPGGGGEVYLWESLAAIFTLASVFSLLVGLAIFSRPSSLKGFEAWANRRLSQQMVQQTAQRVRGLWMCWVLQHPRLTGMLLTAGGGFALWRLLSEWWLLPGGGL